MITLEKHPGRYYRWWFWHSKPVKKNISAVTISVQLVEGEGDDKGRRIYAVEFNGHQVATFYAGWEANKKTINNKFQKAVPDWKHKVFQFMFKTKER